MKSTKPLTMASAVAVSIVLLFLVACGGGGAAPDATQVAEGHKLFQGTCATCHGPNGEGMPKLGKKLDDNEFTQNLSDAELVDFLRIGRSAGDPLNERGVDMPPRGGNPALTDADLALIVAYMRSLQ